ncbi:hypothetical protein L1049_016250 [Liquidambar formosana]|uniref:Uncharacterized protein n=1 Tax=Liquidambar formosana TaxID=63359 RepID=A0AAP0RZ45_LIQFO
MENTWIDAQKDGQDEASLRSLSKEIQLAEENNLDYSESKSKRLVRRVKPKHALTLNVKQSQTSERCVKELFLLSTHSLNNRIPKHIVSLDEKYLRRCLESIHISAAKAATCNISVNLSFLKMGILSENFSSPKFRSTNMCDSAKFLIESPLAAGTGDAIPSPAGQWIVGSITGNKSMINILKSPLFHQFGALDSDANFGRTSLIDGKGSLCSEYIGSPGGLSFCSSQKLEKETVILGNHMYGSEAVHNRLNSISSTNSTSSDQSPSSTFVNVSQGMLQCIWKGKIPHFVFSVDDQRLVYVANLMKVESQDDKALEYMYLFHSRMGSQKEHESRDNESDLVGKMKVSTSFTLCPNNSKFMETEFVLFGANENYVGEMQTSSHNLRKSKGFSKKMVELFKSSHSSKQRSASKFRGTSAILEDCSWETGQDASNNLDALGRANLLENHLPPNLELAAIVLKDHRHVSQPEAEVGGWGLKFLKKVGLKQTSASLKAPVPYECCLRNTGDCSTSMDILVPAGFHGGPKTRNGGPSSLIERWRSGGRCDCGGWDIGCPLTVLNTRSSKEEVLLHTDNQGECKSFDLFIQGTEQCAPTLKLVNIRDGLYFIHFQSTLSALQSFAIAVAIIHTQSPTLRPKNVQELK